MGLFFTDKQEKLLANLHRACERKDAAKVQEALAAGADPNGLRRGSTPLRRAIGKGFADGVRLLLEKKADPNVKGEEGWTPLMLAVYENSAEIARMLIDNGADVNTARNDGRTALHLAGQYGRGDIVKLLLASGADANVTDNRMNTPADVARSSYSRIADLIFQKERKKEPEKPAPAAPAAANVGWRLTAKDEVANVTERAGIGYRLTEIFNFGSGIYTRIARNMNTGAESQSLRFFDEFADRAAIDRAQEALTRLGGEAPEDARRKPSLVVKPQGGAP
jgi:hypothetical protein